MPLWTILIAAILSFLFIFFIFMVYVAYRMAKPPREVGDWSPADFELNYQDFEVENSEHMKIRGWFINRNSDCTIFLLHGYTVSRWTFYIKKMVEFLKDEKYNIVLFDFRAHGKSDGKYTTVGDKEIEDFRAVLQKFRTSKNCVIGYSMGGIIAIRSLMEEYVCCAVADSPPIMMDKTGKRGLKYFANLPEWIYHFAKPFFSMFSGGKTVDMLGYAPQIKKPLLLIEGENDPLITIGEITEFQVQNSRVNPGVSLWINSGAHVRGIVADEEEYRNRVLSFIKEHCVEKEGKK